MINVLIADDNLDFCKNIINTILENINVKVCKVCTNGKETLDELSNTDQIDIIILDMIMPIYGGMEVLSKLSIKQKEKYNNSIIAISGDNTFASQLLDNPLIYDFIFKGTQKEEIIKRIKRLSDDKNIADKRKIIINELEDIGYDRRYKGTVYLIEAIMQIYLNNTLMIDNLQKDIYPKISRIYNKTINNIKCNINNATEAMYYNCDSKKLKEYFNFYDDTKPTTKTVIYTILNKITR